MISSVPFAALAALQLQRLGHLSCSSHMPQYTKEVNGINGALLVWLIAEISNKQQHPTSSETTH